MEKHTHQIKVTYDFDTQKVIGSAEGESGDESLIQRNIFNSLEGVFENISPKFSLKIKELVSFENYDDAFRLVRESFSLFPFLKADCYFEIKNLASKLDDVK